MSREAAIAITRFGLGARKGEIATARKAPHAWLETQLKPENIPDYPAEELGSTKDNLSVIFEYQQQRRKNKGNLSEADMKTFQQTIRKVTQQELQTRYLFASLTNAPVHERLARFWSNHFSVSAISPPMAVVVGSYEREAIRPNIIGSFKELLIAAVTHPAMLIYLDNWQSVGPNSKAGKRRDRGLNENLAREILELHTLSSTGGYTQADVTEFARALTGWTVGNQLFERRKEGEAVFFSRFHEPGERVILGKTYKADGRNQAISILNDLARHPMTARFIATKLARHFSKDDPPLSLVARLEQVFLESDGDLPTVYRALINAPEVWNTAQAKVKTPEDLLTSASRALGIQSVFAGMPRDVLTSLAQRPYNAPSPEGWPDREEDWLGPDALMKRIEWANRVASRSTGVDARAFIETALGELASADTVYQVRLAETGEQALALALMSPEFQRR